MYVVCDTNRPINKTINAKISQLTNTYKKGRNKRQFKVICIIIHRYKLLNNMALKYALYYFILVTVLFGSTVSAHFQMIYPASRGFDESKEPIAPCGGFDTPSSERLSIPRSAFMTIDSGHVSYSYVIKALYNENPSADDFNASNLRQLASDARNYPQAACLPFQFGNDVQDGTKATLQITYNGGDGLLHQVIYICLMAEK